MDANKVFKRHEKKYIISREQKDALLKACGEKLTKNKYFEATVMSLYFDTKNDDLIIKSIDRPEFKEKVRLRSYNVPKVSDEVFLEIKTKRKVNKTKNTYKRRLQIKLSEFYEFFEDNASLTEIAKRKIEKGEDVQIARELEYIFKYLKLEPKAIICCERQSYEGAEDSELRITFDENLRMRRDNLRLENGDKGKKFFGKEKKNIIMEIKAMMGLPIWFVEILNKEKIYPQRFSKYGMCYQKEFMKGIKNV